MHVRRLFEEPSESMKITSRPSAASTFRRFLYAMNSQLGNLGYLDGRVFFYLDFLSLEPYLFLRNCVSQD